ncbi:DUF4209 domain-containing protein [Leptospira montravelensis]|uniref:DUF4209 domain-containing protein n=1 Tax=Leptospira montravelensis TaxID=2484961 RepID=UPI001083BF04|nr:DUF4209 domain-containing protein [Leptospira montravelensis]TGK82997.1 DUF4209 domain-containing protein [Leptospira montravelensis]
MKHIIHNSYNEIRELSIESDSDIFLTSQLIEFLEKIDYKSEDFTSDNYFSLFRSIIFIAKLSFNSDLESDPYYLAKDLKFDNELLLAIRYIEIIQFPDLKARILDLDWCYNRNYKNAIESAILYLNIALSHLEYEHWPVLTDRIERGLILLKSTNQVDLLDEQLIRIAGAFINLEGKDKMWLSYKLLELYYSFSKNYDDKLLNAIRLAIFNKYKAKEFESSRKLALILVNIFKTKKLEKRTRAIQTIVIRLYQKEAEFHNSKQSYFIAASLIQDALDYQKEIKKSTFIKKLLSKLAIEYQQNTTNNFGYYSTEIDRRDIFKTIDNILENATASNFFFKFIKLFNLQSKKDIINTILQNRKEFVFQSIFATTKYDHRNRVAHKYPPLPTDRHPSDEELWPYICENVIYAQSFIGTHAVPYALYKIKSNLQIEYSYIESMVSLSWIVPNSLVKSISKAIFLGYQGDFTSFLYISTPLYESMLRHALTILNDEVLNQDKFIGSQSELTLGQILNNPKIQKLLTENLQIQLKVLLEDDYGIKLRHLLSHGLLDDKIVHAPITFFAFLIFNFIIFSVVQIQNDNGA